MKDMEHTEGAGILALADDLTLERNSTLKLPDTIRVRRLVICENAKIAVPEGKVLTMTVNGVGTAPRPGCYEGDVVLAVSEPYVIPGRTDPFLFGKDLPLRMAWYVENGKAVPGMCVPSMISGGRISGCEAVGITMRSLEENFNGILVKDSDFAIRDSVFDFTGVGSNDNYGVGAAIMGMGRANITLDHVTIRGEDAYLRAMTYIGDDATLNVKNCDISVESGRGAMRSRCWMMGIRGTNRALQQAERAKSYYENCRIHSNGWGLFSTEGTEDCRVYVKKCRCDLSGEIARGYGLMSIGNCETTFDDCDVFVQGYAIIVCEPYSRAVIKGGSRVEATLNAGFLFRNYHSTFRIEEGSVVKTGRSTFVVKGAQADIEVKNSVLCPENGVILQLMDNDDVGIGYVNYIPADDEADVPMEGRDLTCADPEEDVFLTFSDMAVTGDFYNSSTNRFLQIRGEKGEPPDMPKADFSILPPPDPDAPPKPVKRGTGTDLQGAKNVDIKFSNCHVRGVISSATQKYINEVEVITIENCEELCNVTQTAAPAVNNGVIVTIEDNSVWTVTGTSYINRLVIGKGAKLAAPEGKALTMTVDGVSVAPEEGEYAGRIVLTVSDYYIVDGSADPFLHGKDLPIRTACYIKDGVVSDTVSIPSVFQGGVMDAAHAEGVKCVSEEEDFTGIILENSNYSLKDCEFEFTGDGANDNYGVGAAIVGLGDSEITLDNVTLTAHNGVTRAMTYVAEDAKLTVNNSRIVNHSGPTDKMKPAWMLGLRGTNRPTQLCDSAKSVYTNSYIESNGWGLFSVEGAQECSVLVKDCEAVLRGEATRGYGMMSIGNCVDTFDHSKVFVQGYAFLICNPNSQGVITGGSEVEATVYGAMIFRNHNGLMKIDGGSRVKSGASMFVVKGSQTTIECDNCALEAGNGVLLQLMDNDEPGMQRVNFKPANDEEDVYEEGRDLSWADPDRDVFAKFSNMELEGDIFNSTTNLLLQLRGDPGQCPGMPVPDFDMMPKPDPNAPKVRGTETDLQDAHNLDVSFTNVRYTGAISSAKARYRDGVDVISPDNCEEMSNVTQTAAPTVNNGVIVHLDEKTEWTVTGVCYLTRLDIAAGANIHAPAGKTLTATVDGKEIALTAGSYAGKIVLTIA